MTDRKKVVRGLVCCIGNHLCFSCVYYDPDNMRCQKDLMRDALALLKEQEPVEPHVEHDRDDDSWYYGCGACHEAIDYKDRFCRHCGRKVKWDAET